jgi:coupling of ubiquitin conjugation to ER degradation protein 1
MGEVVNVIVAFAVIVILFRWATSSNESPAERSASASLGFRPKNITQDMVDTIHGMFPDIPADNIRYDLLRTGNVELTSNKILEKGFLDAPPPAYFTHYPRTPQAQNAGLAPNTNPTVTTKSPQQSLISRYNLQDRVASLSPSDAPILEEQIGGKAVWEDSPEKREASLKERKAQMILAARQRMLAQQAKTSGVKS